MNEEAKTHYWAIALKEKKVMIKTERICERRGVIQGFTIFKVLQSTDFITSMEHKIHVALNYTKEVNDDPE